MILNPEKVKLGKIVGLDIETNGVYPWLNDILLISICTNNNIYVLEPHKYSYEFIKGLFEELVEDNRLIIGQNIKFDAGFIYHHYNVLLKNVWDTMLADQILYNGLDYGFKLDDIVKRHLGIELENKKWFQKSFIGHKVGEPFLPGQIEYAASDTKYLPELYSIQKELIKYADLKKIIKLELRLLPVLTKMEVKGCKIDKDGWLKMIETNWTKKLSAIIAELDSCIYNLSRIYKIHPAWLENRYTVQYTSFDLFGDHKTTVIENPRCINYASSQQIIELFKLVGEKPPSVKQEDGSTKVGVGEDMLKTYLTENPKTPLKEFIELLLQFREYEKLRSTYGEKFLNRLDSNSYVHTTYSQCYTNTGRLSSKDPNLQNIPASPELRACFLPDDGDLMLTSDMESAEVRIAGDYSKEPKLIGAVMDNEDLHSKLASVTYSIVFGKKVTISKDGLLKVGEYEFIKDKLRTHHKPVLFAKFYKGGAKRIYEILASYINLFKADKAMETAQRVSKAIDKELPVLTEYLSGLISQAQSTGVLRGSKLGRVRYFDSNVYGEAANYPIQNTNAEALKIALIKLDDYFEETGYGRLVMNIHDEVVCSIKPDHAEEVKEVVKKIMGESLGWFLETIPGGASVKIANHWIK